MGRLSAPDPSVISEAIIAWTGWGRTSWPARDESLVVQAFGDASVDLMPAVLAMEDDFYQSDARDIAADLTEMGILAKNQFRNLHPEISDDAIEALAWCYTWDYK